MLEEKLRVLESASNLVQSCTERFSIFRPKFFYCRSKVQKKKKYIFENTKNNIEKNNTNIENRFVCFCAEFNADFKTVFVFLLALIDFGLQFFLI